MTIKKPPRPVYYRCTCCNWLSERKHLCPSCAAGCVMHPERRVSA